MQAFRRAAAPAARFPVVIAACLVAVACAPLTPREVPADAPFVERTLPAANGELAEHAGRIEAELGEAESAFWLLDDNVDALRVRLALTELASETLDIQYFIWQEDMTGRLLMQRVLEAADRGVRVRFLLDDLAVAGRDGELAGLDAHPHVEVRVFNPWKVRFPLGRPFEFVTRIGTLNHRMHNKAFIADGRFGIVGGRNIGDRYFGVYERFVQNDVDLMVAGPLLEAVSASFEQYWRNPLSQALYAGEGGPDAVEALREGCAESVRAHAERLAAFDAPPSGWEAYLAKFLAGGSAGTGELLLDAPAVDATRPDQLYERFKAFVAQASTELILSSPYLVPDEEFVDLIGGLVERGVRVRILTNSLASNSHVVAHSAYKKWRRALLATGAEVYEMRADADILDRYATPPVEPESLALHTKAAVVDRRYSFIGSPNVDPRSMILNTEIGIVADDPALADELVRLLGRDMAPANSWRVTLEPGGWLKWRGPDGALGRQPAQGFQQRLVEFFLNLLPIKSQT